jgi:hypothetical protein
VVERKLNNRSFKRQSVLTVATIESPTVDDKQIWRAIRKELEDIGTSVAAFDANKNFIMNRF